MSLVRRYRTRNLTVIATGYGNYATVNILEKYFFLKIFSVYRVESAFEWKWKEYFA